MAKKYHLSQNGPRLCNASVKACPIGGEDQHFGTQQEAQAAYETRMASAFGTFEAHKRTASEVIRQGAYDVRDTAVAAGNQFVADVKAAPAVQSTVKAMITLKNAPENAKNTFYSIKQSWKNYFAGKAVNYNHLKDEYKANYRALEAASRHNESSPQVVTVAHKIRTGDKTASGLTVIGVTFGENGTIRVTLRGPSGRFAGARVLEPNALVRLDRPNKRAMRRQARRRWTATEHPFISRLKEAGALQRESARVLFGIDSHRVTRNNAGRHKAPKSRPTWSAPSSYDMAQKALNAAKAARRTAQVTATA